MDPITFVVGCLAVASILYAVVCLVLWTLAEYASTRPSGDAKKRDDDGLIKEELL
jgi:hypothetical protein